MGEPVKKGNWGTNMVIERNYIPYKNVSCAACTYYCREDGSCIKTNNIPRIDGWQKWKACNWFDLDTDYMDSAHMEKVREIKGVNFFDRNREEEAEKLEEAKKTRFKAQRDQVFKKNKTDEKLDPIFEQVKKSLESQLNIPFQKVDFGQDIKSRHHCLQSIYVDKPELFMDQIFN